MLAARDARSRPRRSGAFHGGSGHEGLEAGFDFLAARLKEGREGQSLTEGFHWLVDCRARAVRGQLEKDAVRFANVPAAFPAPT